MSKYISELIKTQKKAVLSFKLWYVVKPAECKLAMILGQNLKNQKQILSEDIFLEITMILEQKLRNQRQILSQDLFFREPFFQQRKLNFVWLNFGLFLI